MLVIDAIFIYEDVNIYALMFLFNEFIFDFLICKPCHRYPKGYFGCIYGAEDFLLNITKIRFCCYWSCVVNNPARNPISVIKFDN